MSETPTPPAPGTLLWGDDLNAYLLSLEARIAANEQRFATYGGRLDALEAEPQYVFNSYPWQYSNLAPPPTGNQVRFDNSDLTQATTAVFRVIDSDGADRTSMFQLLDDRSQIRIQDWDNSSAFHHFRVTGPAPFGAGDISIPIAWVRGNGTIPNAKVNVSFLFAYDDL